MAELFSRYASGLQFTAGAIAGSADGVSGLNAIVDRLNSITDNDGAYSNLSVGEGLDISNGSVLSAELASATNKGVASFNSADFTVVAGNVSANSLPGVYGGTGITINNGSVINADLNTLVAGEGIDISNGSTISGELASTTNKGVASFNSSDFAVSTGVVSLGTNISGATQELHISGGTVGKTPSIGDDIANKTYVDTEVASVPTGITDTIRSYVRNTYTYSNIPDAETTLWTTNVSVTSGDLLMVTSNHYTNLSSGDKARIRLYVDGIAHTFTEQESGAGEDVNYGVAFHWQASSTKSVTVKLTQDPIGTTTSSDAVSGVYTISVLRGS